MSYSVCTWQALIFLRQKLIKVPYDAHLEKGCAWQALSVKSNVSK